MNQFPHNKQQKSYNEDKLQINKRASPCNHVARLPANRRIVSWILRKCHLNTITWSRDCNHNMYQQCWFKHLANSRSSTSPGWQWVGMHCSDWESTLLSVDKTRPSRGQSPVKQCEQHGGQSECEHETQWYSQAAACTVTLALLTNQTITT